jgi:hypothetical protein
MSDAESFHASCRINNRHITYSVDCNYYYSTGFPTTTQVMYYEIISSQSYNTGMEKIQEEGIGDSLVPKWSATVGRNDSSICVFENGGHMYVLDMGGNAVSTLINAIKE